MMLHKALCFASKRAISCTTLPAFTALIRPVPRSSSRSFRANHSLLSQLPDNPHLRMADMESLRQPGLHRLPNNQNEIIFTTLRDQVTRPVKPTLVGEELNTISTQQELIEVAMKERGHQQVFDPNLLNQGITTKEYGAQTAETFYRRQQHSMQNLAESLSSEGSSEIQAVAREISLEEHRAEQAAINRSNIFKKMTSFGFFLALIAGTSHAYFKQMGVFGQVDIKDIPEDEIDYTTRLISNANHSVSPLAQEIIGDIVSSLKTPDDHQRYFEQNLPLNPILDPKEAIKLPLLIAPRPSLTQLKFNQIRHDQEMAAVYSTPPLNKNTIHLFLTEEENMNRDFRLSHDKDHVMADPDRPRDIKHLADQLRFQLQLSRF